MPSHPFDTAARNYDNEFTDLQPGRWYRDIVWDYMRRLFDRDGRILDLGCGTGEDAVFLAEQGCSVHAMDLSSGMLDKARRKVADAGVADRVTFSQCDLSALEPDDAQPASGAFSNFGPLNCLERLEPFARSLASRLEPSAPVLLVIMGPYCPWEIVWYLAHLKARTAFRRFKAGLAAPVGGGGVIKVWYHSPRYLKRAFRSDFLVTDLVGIGSLLPPPYLSGLVARAPRFFKALAPMDRRLSRVFPFTWCNDHYMIVMKKK